MESSSLVEFEISNFSRRVGQENLVFDPACRMSKRQVCIVRAKTFFRAAAQLATTDVFLRNFFEKTIPPGSRIFQLSDAINFKILRWRIAELREVKRRASRRDFCNLGNEPIWQHRAGQILALATANKWRPHVCSSNSFSYLALTFVFLVLANPVKSSFEV